MKEENQIKVEKLVNLMRDSSKTMVLTGAGISTDSGIPDFRSRGSGLWEKTDPMEYLTKKTLLENPEKFYSQIYSQPKLKIEELPKPNRGHLILAEMESKELISGIVTQNVDGLHSAAGSKNVYEVHGNLRDGYCIENHHYISTSDIRKKVESGQIPPLCDTCGSVVRSSVVLFGDKLPETYDKARTEIKESDLLIVIGSSLAVAPINFVSLLSKQLVIINREETKMDKQAILIIRDNITEVLEELIRIVNR